MMPLALQVLSLPSLLASNATHVATATYLQVSSGNPLKINLVFRVISFDGLFVGC
jgi:hypothetical protein